MVVRKADIDIAALWAAVLEEAISDALGSRLDLRESAWAWFRSENQGIESFLWKRLSQWLAQTSVNRPCKLSRLHVL